MFDRVSLRAVSIGDDLREIAPMAHRMGFGALQLDPRIGALSLVELSESGRREVRHILAANDLALDSIRMQLRAEGLMSQGVHDPALWAIRKAIELTAELGAGSLCIDLGRLPAVKGDAPPRQRITAQSAGLIIVPEPVSPPAEENDEPEEAAFWGPIDAVLREVGGLADRAGVRVAMSSELSSFASLGRAVQQAACPWFGVDLDPVSVLRDRWDLEKVLDGIGGMLQHIRGRDATRGSSGRTQPAAIGRGNTNWSEMLAKLDAGAYRGWIAVDTVDLPDRAREAQRAVSLLKGSA